MEAKHTPGPLRAVRENEYCANIETLDGRRIGYAHGVWEDGPEAHAEIEANAKLWAAAPDLLRELKALHFDCGVEDCPACAAITKAEGRQ